MNIVFNLIFESAANLMEVGLFFYLICHQLIPKSQYRNKMIYIVPAGIVLMFSVAALLNAFNLNGTIGTIIFFIMQIVFIFLVLSGSKAECFICPVYFIVSDLAAEGLSFFISGGFTSAGPGELVHVYPQRYLLVTSYILILSFFTIIVVKINNKKMILPNTIISILVFIAVLALLFIGLLLDMAIRLELQPNDFQLRLIYSVVIVVLIFIAIALMLFIFAGRTYQEKVDLAKEKELAVDKCEELKVKLNSIDGPKNYEIIENRISNIIDLREVEFFVCEDGAIVAHMKNKEFHKFYKTLDEVSQEVNSICLLFAKINRSFIVNVYSVDKIKSKYVYFDGSCTRINPKYKNDFLEKMRLNGLNRAS